MAERTPGRQSKTPAERPKWAEEKEERRKQDRSRLFRRREDKENEVEDVKEYVRGNRKVRVRKEKEFKGSEKEVTKGLRFDKTNPLAARQARREAEGKHFIAPVAEPIKPSKNMKRLRPASKQSRTRAKPARKSNAETSMSRREPVVKQEAPRRRAEADDTPARERRTPANAATLKERRTLARTAAVTEAPAKPKRKKEGRKYDKPSTIPGERVQKLIANAGLASRREAETWIEQGRVEVNGRVIKLGDKALPTDKVTVNGAPLQLAVHSYYMMHKPKGLVTTRDDKVYKNKTVMDLIPVDERIYPVGRLDKDTTGLLLFTNDGDWANRIMHPRYEVQKVYVATLDKPFNPAHIKLLEQGVRLKEGVVRARVRILSPRKVEVSLHQGINHVVKRIMKEAGYWVTDLARVKVGPLTLDIPLGAFRELTPAEVSLFAR